MSVGEALDAAVRKTVDEATRKAAYTVIGELTAASASIRDDVALTVALTIYKSMEK